MGGVVSLTPITPRGTQVVVDARDNDGQFGATILTGDDRLGGGISVRRAGRGEAGDGQALNTEYEQVVGLLQVSGVAASRPWALTWLPSLGRDIGRSNALYPERRVSTSPEDDHSVLRFEIRDGNRWLLRTYHHYQDWSSDVTRVGERRNLTQYRAHTLGSLLHGSSQTLGGKGSWGLEWVGRHGVNIGDQEFAPDGDLIVSQTLVDGDEDTFGIFVDQAWSFGETDLRAGLRGDYQHQQADRRSTEDTHGSASLRLDHALTEALSVGGELATGYRFPSLSERYFSGTTPRGEVVGNPMLVPETRDSIELSVIYAPAATPLSLEATAFYSDLDDYIERFAVSPGVIGYRNVDTAYIDGVEFSARLRLGAWSHALSYQWQEGEDSDNRILADLNPPEWRYALRWLNGAWAVSSDLVHRPQRTDAGPGEVPLEDATILNLRAGLALGAKWRAEVYATNVFDETYQASADDLAPLQPGRTIGLRMSWAAE
jgi:iron complex outermembrane receptor protein